MNKSEILISQNSEGNIKIDVRLEEGCWKFRTTTQHGPIKGKLVECTIK
mgnify:CR=1 FL=1